MPKSKRATIVHLSKTSKKSKEDKAKLISQIKDSSDAFQYLWLFTIDHVRTVYLQDIRSSWKPSRIYMGRNAVMRIGLGSADGDEHLPGLGTIGKLLEGDAGLLFTNEEPKVVMDWFDGYVRDDYARKGNVATETVELEAGPVMIKEVNDSPSVAPGALEPQLRALGLPTSLQRGVPTLSSPFVVCEEGQKLTTNQAALLKILGYQMAKFKIVLRHVWIKDRSDTFTLDQMRDELK